MPSALKVRGCVVERVGPFGVKISVGSESLCIDVLQGACNHRLYTRLSGNAPSLRPGEEASLGAFRVRATEAYSREDVGDERLYRRGEGVGYIVEAGGCKVYHTGAAGLIAELASAREERATILLLPLGKGAFTPEEGLEVVRSVRPSVVVPLYEDVREAEKLKLLAYYYSQVIILKGEDKWG
ncbi:MAG: MBL fold metallo-hydrolase [Acidilobaceae archaeon]|nr:MBL fold metallo-hydrolase [Acidilobaceae archaeon]